MKVSKWILIANGEGISARTIRRDLCQKRDKSCIGVSLYAV